MQTWIQKYHDATGVSINYQAIGSGGGISALINKTVDFAGSDAPMNAQELSSARGAVLHIPVVIGTECIGYNLPGIGSGLHFTGPVLADIFMGRITFWDDNRLASLNPGTRLPHSRIFVAHRSDGSGTTYIFTDYLSKISPDWKSLIGNGKSVHWPVGLGGKGNAGVAGLLQTHPNSIGYIELAYATENNIAYGVVMNARGKFVQPSAESGSIAAAGVKMPPDMRVSITNTSEPTGYPITGFSWLIVYQNSSKAEQMKKFLTWVLESGQGYNASLQYAKVPTVIHARLKEMIASIH